jgi:uncharacterized protein YecE (DUF72 family)
MTTKSPARVHVGRASLEGNIAKYARSFDLLEVVGEAGRHPRRAGLVQWRKTVGDQFAFSIVVPHALAALDAGVNGPQLHEHARQVAEALEATWWVLRTPPQVTPGARSMRLVEALLAELRVGPRRVAWEPRGVWSDEQAIHAAQALGVSLVRDLAREERLDEDPVVYTRLRALGEGARVGAAAAERVAERLEGAEEAFVVVEGTGAGRMRTVLREAFGGPVAGGGEPPQDDDDDDEDDDEDEDGDQEADEGVEEDDES